MDKDTNSVSIFPLAVWNNILNRIDDPIDLMTLQLVCRNWRDILKPILLRHKDWRSTCFKFVPKFWLEYSVTRLNLVKFKNTQDLDVYTMKTTLENWKSIYMSWRNWQMDARVPLMELTINNAIKFTKTGKISCLAVNRDVVVVGTNEGTIYFTHIQDLTKPFYIAWQEKAVIQVDFGNGGSLCDPDNYYAVTSSIDGHLKFWNYKSKREMPSEGYYGRIISIGVADYKLLTIWGRTVSAYNLCGKNTKEAVTRIWTFELSENETIIAAHAHMYRAGILTFDGHNTMIRIVSDCYSLNVTPQIQFPRRDYFTSRLPDYVLESTAKKFWLFHSEIAICVTDDFWGLSVSNEPWIVHTMGSHLNGRISSVCTCTFTNSYPHKLPLVLGFESGVLCMFNVDIESRKSHGMIMSLVESKQIDSEPIISIAIGFSQNINTMKELYLIIAATENNVHTVESKYTVCNV